MYIQKENQNNSIEDREYVTIPRDLYLNTSRLMTGNDVINIQEKLSRLFKDVKITGVFDEDTDRFVRLFQSNYDFLDINGIVDNKTYNTLINAIISDDNNIYGAVINGVIIVNT